MKTIMNAVFINIGEAVFVLLKFLSMDHRRAYLQFIVIENLFTRTYSMGCNLLLKT